MGACDFGATQFGKDVQDAFLKAVDQARYENGHGGYTGTIAEKTDYMFVDLQAMKVTMSRFGKLMQALDEERYAKQEADPYFKRTKREQAKLDTKVRRAKAKVERLAKGMSPSAVHTIKVANEAADDKWGPAVAVKITGKEAKELRARHGLQRRKGDFFNFFGTASL